MSVEIGLESKTAIVTGAGSGIGAETALLLARAGANVVVGDINGEAAEKTAAAIAADGGASIGVTVDVRDPELAGAAVAAAVERFGAVDILVNNAAAWTPKLFKDIELAEIERDLGVTLIGTMVMSKAVFAVMREQRRGVIVNLVSDSARIGEPFLVAYGAAKGGVMAFTKGLAKEAARYDVRVNAVSPGTTKTPGANPVIERWGGEEKLRAAYPLGRLGEPIDQANAILFFCSDLSSWVTGQILSVSGGYSMAD